MASRERGLPAEFVITVPEEVLRPPSEAVPLRDFLDEAIATKEAAGKAVGTSAAIARDEMDARQQPPPPPLPPRMKRRSWPQPSAFRLQPRSSDDDRLQLRMTPEARQTLEALVEHFTRYGPSKRTPASDIIGALILALGDARRELELQDLPRRGGYGTPSAEAHRVHMKHAVAGAIARHCAKLADV